MKKSFGVYDAKTGRKLGKVNGNDLKKARKTAAKKFKNKTVTVR